MYTKPVSNVNVYGLLKAPQQQSISSNFFGHVLPGGGGGGVGLTHVWV